MWGTGHWGNLCAWILSARHAPNSFLPELNWQPSFPIRWFSRLHIWTLLTSRTYIQTTTDKELVYLLHTKTVQKVSYLWINYLSVLNLDFSLWILHRPVSSSVLQFCSSLFSISVRICNTKSVITVTCLPSCIPVSHHQPFNKAPHWT